MTALFLYTQEMRFPTLLSLFFLSACSYDPYYYYYSCISYEYKGDTKALALVLHNDELLTENRFGDVNTYEKDSWCSEYGCNFLTSKGGKDGQIVQLLINTKELDKFIYIYETTWSKKYEDSETLRGEKLSEADYRCRQIARTLTATHK